MTFKLPNSQINAIRSDLNNNSFEGVFIPLSENNAFLVRVIQLKGDLRRLAEFRDTMVRGTNIKEEYFVEAVAGINRSIAQIYKELEPLQLKIESEFVNKFEYYLEMTRSVVKAYQDRMSMPVEQRVTINGLTVEQTDLRQKEFVEKSIQKLVELVR